MRQLTLIVAFVLLAVMVVGCDRSNLPSITTSTPTQGGPDPQPIQWNIVSTLKPQYYKGALIGISFERAILNRGSPGDVTAILSIKPAGGNEELWSKVFFMDANLPYQISAYVPTPEDAQYSIDLSVRPSLPNDKNEGNIGVRELLPSPELEKLALGTPTYRGDISYALTAWEVADAFERTYGENEKPEGGRYSYTHCEPKEGYQYLLARMKIVNNSAEVWPDPIILNPEIYFRAHGFQLILDESQYAEQPEYAYRHMILGRMWRKRPWVRLQPEEEWEDDLVFEIPKGTSLENALLLANFGGEEGWTWWQLTNE